MALLRVQSERGSTHRKFIMTADIQKDLEMGPLGTRHSDSEKAGLLKESADSGFTADSSTWGREHRPGFIVTLACLALFVATPFMIYYYWLVCEEYECSLWKPVDLWMNSDRGMWSILFDAFPGVSFEAVKIFTLWYLYQLVLAIYLPGNKATGARTPAGYQLEYNCNGLQAWIVTHVMFVIFTYMLGLFPAALPWDNWGQLMVVCIIFGFGLSFFAYYKAHHFPSHPGDCKFSGNSFYDFFMGIELNPRIGKIDFKLFHNGRPGIVGWTVINLVYASAQYREFGFVSNSMVLVNILQAFYVVDLFVNESWYLRTIDIHHDHFGFYLAFGDMAFLPFMYTLQGWYLTHNPVQLNWLAFIIVLGAGLTGYWIFRSANSQKDAFRANPEAPIWGKKPKYVKATYKTADGQEHTSLLLASGWWGVARHFNYVGDLLLSTSMCLACGLSHFLPYFYAVWMLCLLLHREHRDDHRCGGKYGKYWEEYCKLVPWRMFPGLY